MTLFLDLEALKQQEHVWLDPSRSTGTSHKLGVSDRTMFGNRD